MAELGLIGFVLGRASCVVRWVLCVGSVETFENVGKCMKMLGKNAKESWKKYAQV